MAWGLTSFSIVTFAEHSAVAQFAVVKTILSIGILIGFASMRNHDHCATTLAELAEHPQDFLGILGIEIAGRFVSQDQVGL